MSLTNRLYDAVCNIYSRFIYPIVSESANTSSAVKQPIIFSRLCLPSIFSLLLFTWLIPCPRVLNLGDNQITRANLRQLVHGNRNLLPQHHSLDRDPAIFLESVDGRRASARCDFAGGVEFRALDVVCAEDVFLRGW